MPSEERSEELAGRKTTAANQQTIQCALASKGMSSWIKDPLVAMHYTLISAILFGANNFIETIL